MIMSYRDLQTGKREKVRVRITTNHPNSSYGQAVIVLPNGGLLGSISWVAYDWQVETASASERKLLSTIPFLWDFPPDES